VKRLRHARPGARCCQRQRGQALLYGLFVLLGGLVGLFFLFNTGQLVREKTKLVDTADAVAYSAGVIQARALNHAAYSNRALMAHEALIAQLVSLQSWATYLRTWVDRLPAIHPECRGMAEGARSGNVPVAFASAVSALRKFGPDYALACGALSLPEVGGTAVPELERFANSTLPAAIAATEASKAIITVSQGLMFSSTLVARDTFLQRVADDNYRDIGPVRVESGLVAGLSDDWLTATERYTGDQRGRLREVVLAAAHADPFVRERGWTSRAVLPEPSCLAVGRVVRSEVRRRGSTELLGFDEWQALDTQSFQQRFRRRLSCRQREVVTAWASDETRRNDQSPAGERFGGARTDTPTAHAIAQANIRTGTAYRGLPDFHDLRASRWLSGANTSAEPLIRHGVRLTRAQANLATSDEASQVRTRANGALLPFDTAPAGGVMAAVATAEVYFARPPAAGVNRLGQSLGRARELGSLFNPYWQVRLVSTPLTVPWARQAGLNAP